MVKSKRLVRDYNLPPSIIVYEVKDIQLVQDLLNEIVGKKYTMKVLANDYVEIQISEKNKLGPIIASLKTKDIIFEIVHKNKLETFKVFLRNMHPSVNKDEIVKELLLYGHKVINISNVKTSTTNESTPIFLVELECRDNNDSIYSVTNLSHMIVNFEPVNLDTSYLRRNVKPAVQNDTSSDESASDTKQPEKEAPSSSRSLFNPPTTSAVEPPIAYVQPICSQPPKNNRQNTSASGSGSASASASTSASTSSDQNSPFSGFTMQEKVELLNRLNNLDIMMNSTYSCVKSTLELAAILSRRLNKYSAQRQTSSGA